MKIKKALSLSFALALSSSTQALPRGGQPRLDCLQASAQSGGLAGCLGEPRGRRGRAGGRRRPRFCFDACVFDRLRSATRA